MSSELIVHPEDAASRLWAHEQIKQLKAAYFRAVDTQDYPCIAALFTEDAAVDFTGELRHHIGHHGVTAESLIPAPQIVIGGLAAAKVIEDAIDGLVTVHHGHDPLIEITSSTSASGRWSLHDILEYEKETMHGYGHYTEEYRLVEGRWKFSRLILSRLRVVWTTRLA